MSIKFATLVIKNLKMGASNAAPEPVSYSVFGAKIGAQKPNVRTQATLNGMPIAWGELEKWLYEEYKNRHGATTDSEAARQVNLAINGKSELPVNLKTRVGAAKEAKVPLAQDLQTFGRCDRVITDPADLKSLPAGTYTVAGAASQMVSQNHMNMILRTIARRKQKVHATRVHKKALAYRSKLLLEIMRLCNHKGAQVRILDGNSTITKRPKCARVAKQLRKLVGYLNLAWHLKAPVKHNVVILNHEGNING